MKFLLILFIILASVCAYPQTKGVEDIRGLDFVSQDTKESVFIKKYGCGNTFSNQYSDRTEELPCEYSFKNLDSVSMDSNKTLYHSYEEYSQYYDKELHISTQFVVQGIPLSGDFRKEQGRYKQWSDDETKYLAQQTHYVLLYSVSVPYVPWTITDDWLQAVENLKVCTNTEDPICKAQYCDLILDFGSHQAISIVQGGLMNATIAYDKEIEQRHTTEWTRESLSVGISYLRGLFGLHEGDYIRWEDIEKEIREGGQFYYDTYGGVHSDNITVWLPTLAKDPVNLWMKSQYIPLHYLIEPDSADRVLKRKFLKQVLLNYLSSGGMYCDV